MIKVINIVQDFNMGGIQSVLLSLLRAFKDDEDIDYSVAVLENPRGSEFDRIAAKEELNITYLGCSQSKSSHYFIRKYHRLISYNGRLFRYLQKEKPDIVHTHNTRILTLIMKCIRATKNKYVWFHTLHSDPYAVHEGHIPCIQKAVNEYHVHPVCLNETQFFKARDRYGLLSCDYIYNMVQLDKFHNTLQNREMCRKKLLIPTDAYVIGTVGRLDAVKNYRFLLRVFAKASVRNPKAILVFTGDGDEMEQLKKDAVEFSVADKVIFLGVRKDTEAVYPAFDVFVSTSITESSSLVVLEAQATGLPCVVSAACPKESVITDRVVRMKKDANEDEWAEQLLVPSAWFLKCAEEEDYSKEKVAERLKLLYKHYLEEKGKST